MNINILWLILTALYQTLFMTTVAGVIAILLGLPSGILLYALKTENLLKMNRIYYYISIITDILRAIPFIILLIILTPFTRMLIGTSIGTLAAVIPLSLSAMPFVARIVENALSNIPANKLYLGITMGGTNYQIIKDILIPEALPAMINGITVMLVTLVGYSAMAGTIGGGGLGDLAIRYGYHRFDIQIMVITVILIVLIVNCIQFVGNYFANHLYNKI